MIAATYVINLAASAERWRDMQAVLTAMRAPNPIRFDGVDGGALGEAGIESLQAARRLARDDDETAVDLR